MFVFRVSFCGFSWVFVIYFWGHLEVNRGRMRGHPRSHAGTQPNKREKFRLPSIFLAAPLSPQAPNKMEDKRKVRTTKNHHSRHMCPLQPFLSQLCHWYLDWFTDWFTARKNLSGTHKQPCSVVKAVFRVLVMVRGANTNSSTNCAKIVRRCRPSSAKRK